MIFESISSGGCRSYLVGCEETCAAALIDPELSQIDRYNALAARHGLRFRYLIDTPIISRRPGSWPMSLARRS
jgi:hypothetical protein